MEEKILKTLTDIGLTNGESKTYMALISLGTTTTGPIIKKSGVSASKVYNILDRLILKGLATMVAKDKKKLFSPTNPEELITSIDREQKKLEINKQAAKDILPILKSKIESVSKQPIAEFSRGERGFRTLHKEIVDSAKKEDVYLGTAGKQISFKMQKYWSQQNRDLAKKRD